MCVYVSSTLSNNARGNGIIARGLRLTKMNNKIYCVCFLLSSLSLIPFVLRDIWFMKHHRCQDSKCVCCHISLPSCFPTTSLDWAVRDGGKDDLLCLACNRLRKVGWTFEALAPRDSKKQALAYVLGKIFTDVYGYLFIDLLSGAGGWSAVVGNGLPRVRAAAFWSARRMISALFSKNHFDSLCVK